MSACKRLSVKKTLFVLTVITLLVMVKLFDKLKDHKRRWSESITHKTTELPTDKLLKVFHLDLKGAPPNMSFLIALLPLIRRSGANAILIEYEDMFPFSGRLANISATNAYSFEEVRRTIRFAEALSMEVIPLVQTFGHLEYVLKLEEFRHLREVDSFPQEICPTNREAVDVVKEMISQVMAVHANSRYLHIGCDEVRHVGACPRCSRINHKALFARHVTRMAGYIKWRYPKVTPLIWDDMLRRWTYSDLISSGLSSSVEPVVWVYGNNIFTLVPPFVWNIYQSVFPKIWVASAFKGAFGETEILPNLTRHLENHLSWMRVLSGKEDIVLKPENVSGIFLTGWSRYDHFAVLCELLPVGVPSLLLGVVFLDPHFADNPSEGFSKWLSILGCPSTLISIRGQNEFYFQDKLGNCSFPGSNLYSGVVQFMRLRKRVMEMAKKVEGSGWGSRYNVRKNFTSPWRLMEMLPEEGFAGEVLRKEMQKWKASFMPLVGEFFDKHTEAEWEELNVKPLEEKLAEIERNFRGLLMRKTWPRRPLRRQDASPTSHKMADHPNILDICYYYYHYFSRPGSPLGSRGQRQLEPSRPHDLPRRTVQGHHPPEPPSPRPAPWPLSPRTFFYDPAHQDLKIFYISTQDILKIYFMYVTLIGPFVSTR